MVYRLCLTHTKFRVDRIRIPVTLDLVSQNEQLSVDQTARNAQPLTTLPAATADTP